MMHLGKHSSIRPKKIRQDREQAEDVLVERSRDAEASEKASNAGINPLATGRPKAASVYSLSAWPAVKSSRPRKMGRSSCRDLFHRGLAAGEVLVDVERLKVAMRPPRPLVSAWL
jgi:hypothetical protein